MIILPILTTSLIRFSSNGEMYVLNLGVKGLRTLLSTLYVGLSGETAHLEERESRTTYLLSVKFRYVYGVAMETSRNIRRLTCRYFWRRITRALSRAHPFRSQSAPCVSQRYSCSPNSRVVHEAIVHGNALYIQLNTIGIITSQYELIPHSNPVYNRSMVSGVSDKFGHPIVFDAVVYNRSHYVTIETYTS